MLQHTKRHIKHGFMYSVLNLNRNKANRHSTCLNLIHYIFSIHSSQTKILPSQRTEFQPFKEPLMNKPTIVKCPRCGTPAAWLPENPYRPFCSRRCKTIDLGAWVAEEYALPTDEGLPSEQIPHTETKA